MNKARKALSQQFLNGITTRARKLPQNINVTERSLDMNNNK